MQPIIGLSVIVFMAGALAIGPAGAQTAAQAQTPGMGGAAAMHLLPGEEFLPSDVRAKQADDFDNPAYPYVEAGEATWSKPEGLNGKSCEDCHGPGSKSNVKQAAASYPKYVPSVGKIITLESRINICRRNGLNAPALQDSSDQMVAMVAYLRWLSRGLPAAVNVSGQAASVFERGGELFYTKIGLLQLSCAQCHNQRYGQKFGGETLSQGHALSYPVYSLSQRRMIPLHERFRMCNLLARAEPQPINAPDYVALELYLNWRSKQLTITAPGVRP